MIAKGNPVLAAVYSFMFAYAQALAASMQNFGIPSQIVLALPYFMTIAVLLVSGIRGRVKKGAVETASGKGWGGPEYDTGIYQAPLKVLSYTPSASHYHSDA